MRESELSDCYFNNLFLYLLFLSSFLVCPSSRLEMEGRRTPQLKLSTDSPSRLSSSYSRKSKSRMYMPNFCSVSVVSCLLCSVDRSLPGLNNINKDFRSNLHFKGKRPQRSSKKILQKKLLIGWVF